MYVVETAVAQYTVLFLVVDLNIRSRGLLVGSLLLLILISGVRACQ